MPVAVAGCVLALTATRAGAEFDPARVLKEPEAIARQFPDPDVRYPTPGLLDGRIITRRNPDGRNRRALCFAADSLTRTGGRDG